MSRANRKDEMFRYVREYLSTTKTKKEICSEHNLKMETFKYWLRKYRRNNPDEGRFIPIEVDNGSVSKSSDSCRIEFPNGIVIHINI